jgi:hypothetical protein
MQNTKLKTPKEAKALGLRRISREERPQVPKEMTIKDCQIITTVKIDADIYNFLESKSEGEESIEKLLNTILRERFEKEEASKLTEIREIRSKLLNDRDFLQELKEKLAV